MDAWINSKVVSLWLVCSFFNCVILKNKVKSEPFLKKVLRVMQHRASIRPFFDVWCSVLPDFIDEFVVGVGIMAPSFSCEGPARTMSWNLCCCCFIIILSAQLLSYHTRNHSFQIVIHSRLTVGQLNQVGPFRISLQGYRTRIKDSCSFQQRIYKP